MDGKGHLTGPNRNCVLTPQHVASWAQDDLTCAVESLRNAMKHGDEAHYLEFRTMMYNTTTGGSCRLRGMGAYNTEALYRAVVFCCKAPHPSTSFIEMSGRVCRGTYDGLRHMGILDIPQLRAMQEQGGFEPMDAGVLCLVVCLHPGVTSKATAVGLQWISDNVLVFNESMLGAPLSLVKSDVLECQGLSTLHAIPANSEYVLKHCHQPRTLAQLVSSLQLQWYLGKIPGISGDVGVLRHLDGCIDLHVSVAARLPPDAVQLTQLHGKDLLEKAEKAKLVMDQVHALAVVHGNLKLENVLCLPNLVRQPNMWIVGWDNAMANRRDASPKIEAAMAKCHKSPYTIYMLPAPIETQQTSAPSPKKEIGSDEPEVADLHSWNGQAELGMCEVNEETGKGKGVTWVVVDWMAGSQSLKSAVEKECPWAVYVPLDIKKKVFSVRENKWLLSVQIDLEAATTTQVWQRVQEEAWHKTQQRTKVKLLLLAMSPCCKTYSRANTCNVRRGCHYRDYTDKFRRPRKRTTKWGRLAAQADRQVQLAIRMADWAETVLGAPYYLENPVGDLCKRPFMRMWERKRGVTRHMLHYCAYKHPFKKATHVWTRMKWIPKGLWGDGKCKQGACQAGEWSKRTGRWKHSFTIAGPIEETKKGRGRWAWKNMMPEMLQLELLRAAVRDVQEKDAKRVSTGRKPPQAGRHTQKRKRNMQPKTKITSKGAGNCHCGTNSIICT